MPASPWRAPGRSIGATPPEAARTGRRWPAQRRRPPGGSLSRRAVPPPARGWRVERPHRRSWAAGAGTDDRVVSAEAAQQVPAAAPPPVARHHVHRPRHVSHSSQLLVRISAARGQHRAGRWLIEASTATRIVSMSLNARFATLACATQRHMAECSRVAPRVPIHLPPDRRWAARAELRLLLLADAEPAVLWPIAGFPSAHWPGAAPVDLPDRGRDCPRLRIRR